MTDPLINRKQETLNLKEYADPQPPESETRIVTTEDAAGPNPSWEHDEPSEGEDTTKNSSKSSGRSPQATTNGHPQSNKSAISGCAREIPEGAPAVGDHYDLLEKIGEGAMGTVWKVYDRSLKQIFALKTLRPELLQDSEAVQRFEQEARLAIELAHPHIAAVYGPGKDDQGLPFIIMDFIDGESLASVLAREGKIDAVRALNITQQICEALSHAHMHGIVHRDIKPSNILITRTESGGDVVSVVDFGIARSIYEEVHLTQALTRPMGDFATPTYMSPEQCMGHAVTAHSDIYSLGCVLFEMLTGLPPFTEKNQVRLIVQHLNEEPDLSSIPLHLHTLLTGCLAKGIELRPKSADQLSQKIEKILKHGHRFGPLTQTPAAFSFASMLFILPFLICPIKDHLDRVLTGLIFWLFLVLIWVSLTIVHSSTILRTKKQNSYEKALATLLLVVPLELAMVTAGPQETAQWITASIISGLLFLPLLHLVERSDWYDSVRNLVSQSKDVDTAGVRNLCCRTFTDVCIPVGLVLSALSAAGLLTLYSWQPVELTPFIQNKISSSFVIAFLLALLHFCITIAIPTKQNTMLWKVAQRSLTACSVQFAIALMAAFGIVLAFWGPTLRDIGLIAAVSKRPIYFNKTEALLRPIVKSSKPLQDDSLGNAFVSLAGKAYFEGNTKLANDYAEQCLRLLENRQNWTTLNLPKTLRSLLGIEYTRTNCALDLARAALQAADTEIASRALATLNHSKEPLTTNQWERVKSIQEECAVLNSVKQIDRQRNGNQLQPVNRQNTPSGQK